MQFFWEIYKVKYMKKITAYHGSNNDFDEFSSKFMGTNGTHEGFGFYFTTNPNITKSFGKIMYTCELSINKLISNKKKTIPKPIIKKVIMILDKKTDGMFLSAYGDVDYEGYNSVLNEAVNSVYNYSDTDTEMFGDMVNSNGSYDSVAECFIGLGYNAMIEDAPDWGTADAAQEIIVMFNPADIKIVNKSLNKIQESFISLDSYNLGYKKGWL